MSAGHGVNIVESLVCDSIEGQACASSETLVSALFVALIIFAFVKRSRAQLALADRPLVPEKKLSARNMMELIAEFVLRLGDQMMGRRNRKYLPFVGTIFFYLLCMNLLGLIPGFSAPTDSFAFNLGIASIVFVMYNYWGIKEVGIVGYIKHLWGPVWWIGWFVMMVEIISHFIRPISLSIRLFGNMTGDHMVLQAFTDMTKLIIPVIFYGLGTFVSFMQAFVFTLLTMLYIGFATAHEEH